MNETWVVGVGVGVGVVVVVVQFGVEQVKYILTS